MNNGLENHQISTIYFAENSYFIANLNISFLFLVYNPIPVDLGCGPRQRGGERRHRICAVGGGDLRDPGPHPPLPRRHQGHLLQHHCHFQEIMKIFIFD